MLPLARIVIPLLGVALGSCSSNPGPVPVDARPMYGAPEIPRPSLLRQADARFVQTASAEFAGNRKLASLSWTGQGDRLLASGNLDDAMRRYNEAWLLDPDNFEVYEGFARVLLARGQTAAAIPHFRKAIELCPDDTERAALTAELQRLSK